MLVRVPMHGYDILRAFEESRAAQWSGLLKGSIYHALKSMACEGMLEIVGEEAAPSGARTIYKATAKGRTELKRLLKKAWKASDRPFPTTTYTALAFFDVLPH